MALSAGTPASARNTPVYRYAMYNWASTPYEVFYFHEGTPAKEDEAVNKLLVELSEAEPPANVYFHEVDLSEEERLSKLHPLIKKLYEANAEVPKPMHLIITPWGAELFAGRLDEAKVKAMVASPARTKMAELLAEGNITVLMVLTGPNADENQRAEKVAGEVVDQITSGEIPVGIDPGGFGPEMPYDDNEEGDDKEDGDSKGKAKIAVLKVSRTDAAEEWLVRMLLSVEPDLDEFSDDTMIFAAYGRGRAMPPYIGKGITADNLIDCVMFLAGACSCMVKDQNPGMDLLMQCDWNATADALAANDPTLDDDPWGYQEFESQQTEESNVESTADAPAEDAPAEDSPAEDTPAEDTPAEDSPPGDAETTGESEPAVAATEAEQTPVVNSAEGAISPAATDSVNSTVATAKRIGPASFAMRQAWTIGLGLAVGAVLVVVAGLVLVRRPPQ